MMGSRALLALLFFVSYASAQQQVQLLNYDALPGCAKGCTNLKTAQDGCIPPQAGVSNQQTYVSCFCQSAFLVNLKTTAQGLCDAACPGTGDQNAIKDWYNKYCQSGGTEGAAGGSGTKTEPSKTAASSSPSATTAKNNNNEQGVVSDKTSYQGSWISAHWRWIVMIVVIFTGLSLLTLFGLWLKRRSRARHDARQANVAAPEAAFAAPLPPAAPPLAHQHHQHHKEETSTIDFGSTSSITATNPSSSVANIAQSFLGRNRSRSNPLGRFPNTSQNNVVQPVPSPINVWGPHQHQAATRGYEYPTYHAGSGLNDDASSPVSPSPVASSPNASFPHVIHPHSHLPGPGPSPLGNGSGSSVVVVGQGTPRKSSSRGELVSNNKSVPLIAAAGNNATPKTPPSTGSSSSAKPLPGSATRPEVPRLNTAVGANAPTTAKALPPQPQPTTPPRPTPPKQLPQTHTPPQATAGASSSSATTTPPVSRPPPANSTATPSRSAQRDRERHLPDDSENERHHHRTRSQEYGAAATYHNAGFATGGSVYRRKDSHNNNNNDKNNGKEGGVLGSRGGALVDGDDDDVDAKGFGKGSSGVGGGLGDAVAGAANMVARSFDDLHGRAVAAARGRAGHRDGGGAGDAGFGGGWGTDTGGAGTIASAGGSRRRVTSPLSADNAREKLRRKLSRQGSGFFDQVQQEFERENQGHGHGHGQGRD